MDDAKLVLPNEKKSWAEKKKVENVGGSHSTSVGLTVGQTTRIVGKRSIRVLYNKASFNLYKDSIGNIIQVGGKPSMIIYVIFKTRYLYVK